MTNERKESALPMNILTENMAAIKQAQLRTSKEIEMHCHLGGNRRVCKPRNVMSRKNVEGVTPVTGEHFGL